MQNDELRNANVLFQSLLDMVSCVSTSVSGDPIRADETSLLVMNHRSARLDALFFLSAAFRATNPTCAQNRL